MTSRSPESNRFSLLGEQLPVRSSQSPELIDKAFQRLEARIKTMRGRSPEASRLQAALMAALNLSGELIRLEDQLDQVQLTPDARDQIEDLQEQIEQQLHVE